MKSIWTWIREITMIEKVSVGRSAGEKAALAGRAVLGICAALGWWGFLYPELTLTPDTYAAVETESVQDAAEAGAAKQYSEKEGSGELACEEQNPAAASEWDFDGDIYRRLLEAEAGQIHFKSRLLMELRRASIFNHNS